MNPHHPLRGLARVLLLAALLGIAPSCGRKAAPSAPPVRPVRTITIGVEGATLARSFSGRARPAVGTMLSFRVGGELRELTAKIGLTVKVGDVIARLDTTDFELKVKQLDAQLAQAEAQLKQATADYERSRGLYEAGSASRSELDKSRAAFESTQAQKDAIGKSLELARQQLEYCTLRSPMDGTISTVPVDVHAQVQSGAAIAGLSAGATMEVEAGVPESLIRYMRVGDHARVVFDTLPDSPFDADVTEVGIQASEATTYPVRLRLPTVDSRVLAGMVCNVTFDLQRKGEEGTVVPSVAVVGTPQGSTFVWIVDPKTHHVTRRDVKVGTLTSSGLQVLAGLATGDVIVVRGVHLLSENMQVRLLDD